MSELLKKINELAAKLETRLNEVRVAAMRHDEEDSSESLVGLRLSIAHLKPVTKEMRYMLKTSNVI